MLCIMPDSSGQDVKSYLEYLDKEMTIMGILSTFCVAAASLVIDRVCGADKSSYFQQLAQSRLPDVLVGSGFLLLACLCFYLQRSLLAFYYGGICMSIARPGQSTWSMERWLIEADSWATWIRYRFGFMFLILATVAYGVALWRTSSGFATRRWWIETIVASGIILFFSTYAVILSAYRYEDYPLDAFSFETVVQRWRTRGELTPPAAQG